MIQIPGLDLETIYEIIDKVAKNHQSKTFDYHQTDDIYQKVWEICLEKLHYFELDRGLYENPSKCLEHWLNTIVARRLSNFKRDTYDVKQRVRKTDRSNFELEIRKSILRPAELNDMTDAFTADITNDNDYLEYLTFLYKNLNDKDKILLDAVLSGEKIPTYYKTQLIDNIRSLNYGS